MEAKAILYNLLLNFSFEANEKTQIPMKLKKTPFTIEMESGMHLELKHRKFQWHFHKKKTTKISNITCNFHWEVLKTIMIIQWIHYQME